MKKSVLCKPTPWIDLLYGVFDHRHVPGAIRFGTTQANPVNVFASLLTDQPNSKRAGLFSGIGDLIGI